MLVDQTQIKDLKAQIANMNTYDIQEEVIFSFFAKSNLF